MSWKDIKTFEDALDALNITAMGMPINEVPEAGKDERDLKYVYCPVNADMTVYDFLNNRVYELSGTLTIEKYFKIIARSTKQTEFDGKERLEKKFNSLKYKINEEGFPFKNRKQLIAQHKLMIICEAVNDGWIPDWDNDKQYKYYPYFDMRSKGKGSSGFGFHNAGNVFTYSHVGSRLCLEKKEKAEHVAKHFLEEYKDMFTM